MIPIRALRVSIFVLSSAEVEEVAVTEIFLEGVVWRLAKLCGPGANRTDRRLKIAVLRAWQLLILA